MNEENRIGWMIQIECTCEVGVIHLVSECEIMDMSGELPGTVTSCSLEEISRFLCSPGYREENLSVY